MDKLTPDEINTLLDDLIIRYPLYTPQFRILRDLALRALSLESVRSEADVGLFDAGRVLGFIMGLEEAAKVCDLIGEENGNSVHRKCTNTCAAAIRALQSPARMAESPAKEQL